MITAKACTLPLKTTLIFSPARLSRHIQYRFRLPLRFVRFQELKKAQGGNLPSPNLVLAVFSVRHYADYDVTTVAAAACSNNGQISGAAEGT